MPKDLSSVRILEQEGERRGELEPPDGSDFEAHIETYRGFKRIVAITIAHLAVILLAMYFFLVR